MFSVTTFNPGVDALVGRGISLDKAKQLIRLGHNIKNLKKLNISGLIKLDLTKGEASAFLSKRPPIPEGDVIKLLCESRSTCCVCRSETESIIIHHIKYWEESHSHSEENLVVLCLNCHDKAHSKKELTQNLTPSKVKELKRRWLNKVIELDRKRIQGYISEEGVCWDYFNIKRIYELVNSLDIDLTNFDKESKNEILKVLQDQGYVNNEGLLISQDKFPKKVKDCPPLLLFMYNYPANMYICSYFGNIFYKIISKLQFKDLNKSWGKKNLVSTIQIGDFITCQGAFYFRELNKRGMSEGQKRIAYRKANGIKIEFEFDAWYL